MQRGLLAGLFLLLSLAPGCAWVLSPFHVFPPGLHDVRQDSVPLLVDDADRDSLRFAIERSVEFYDRNAERIFVAGGTRFSGAQFASSFRGVLAALPYLNDTISLDTVLRSVFRILQVTGKRRPVRFTGYYTPVLRGSLEPGGPYQYPVYARPPDLVTLDAARVSAGCECAPRWWTGRLQDGEIIPYYTRAEIDRGGALSQLGLELAWTDDPVRLFFLHIQGSGRLLLPDGSAVQLNYAATNGQPYRSVGQVLARRGVLPPGGGSMQRVRAYLIAHPGERDEILEQNERYTFFRVAENGPLGSIEVEVTPGRSIATDPHVFPPGALAYIRTRVPVIGTAGAVVGWRPLRRLVLNQDTGTAIRGPTHVDIYFGTGDAAEHVAGQMLATGDLYIMLPRAAEPPSVPPLTTLVALR